jgi:hypothetical protein
MALYLVVRHRQNLTQRFHNVWQNDDLLTSIQTTLEIGKLCMDAKAQKQWVYIHRCRYGVCPPTICCSVHVAVVADIGGLIIVEFRDQTPLNIAPGAPPPPEQGQSYYRRPPP